MKVARLLFVCFMLISLTTCTKDESLAEANHPSPNEVNSLVGSLFIKQMRSQIGSSECFTRSLGGTPLYEYTILAVGYNWVLLFDWTKHYWRRLLLHHYMFVWLPF